MLEVGDEIELWPETLNDEDKHAIMVYTDSNAHIGYVEKKYSRVVSENLDDLVRCVVTKKSRHKIPFINARAEFSTVINHPDSVQNQYEFYNTSMGCAISGTYEESAETIKFARNLKPGTPVKLVKAQPTEYVTNRYDVFSEEGIFLGFLEPFHSDKLEPNFDLITDVKIETPLPVNEPVAFMLRVYFKPGSELKSPTHVTELPYGIIYPELYAASKLKRTDTAKALQLALPIAEKEKGIEAKFICCQCYRLTKDYDSELIMIEKIINHINSLTDEIAAPGDIQTLKIVLDREIARRYATVKSRIESRNKKIKKS